MKTLKLLQINFIQILLSVSLLIGCSQGWDVEQGQIWVKEYNIDNPYEEIKRDTIYIIQVCGDYVKFKRKGKIMNDNKFWIPVNARKIK